MYVIEYDTESKTQNDGVSALFYYFVKNYQFVSGGLYEL